MFLVYMILIVVVSLFLILLCLVQSSRKENSFGGIAETSGFSQIVGIKKTFDVLEKLTLSSAFIVFLLCILSYYSLTSSKNKKLKVSTHDVQNTDDASKEK